MAIQNAPANATGVPPSVDGSNANIAPESSFSFKDIPRTINNIPPPSSSWNWGWGERKEAERTQEERDRLAEIRRQAVDTVSPF